MLNIVLLLTVVALVQSHDVKVGNSTEGRKIFDEVRHASPTIWRQTETLTINTTDTEVISRVVITDLRPNKDGDVKILEGGEGHNNVTIELKSPTVLRGYDFKIEVYSVPDTNQVSSVDKQDPTDPGQVRKQRNPEELSKSDKSSLDLPLTIIEDVKKIESTTDKNRPGSIAHDTKINEDETKTDSNAEKVNDDKLKVGSETVTDRGNNNPAATIPHSKASDSINNDHTRHGRDATSETPQNGNQQTTPKENKITTPSPSQRSNEQVRPLHDNGFVIHPGIDYSNYSASELFPVNNASKTQEEKRNVRDITNDNDKPQPPLTNEQSKTFEDTHVLLSSTTTAKSVTEDSGKTQQPRINEPFPKRPLDPVPYPIQRTTSAAPTTEKSIDKTTQQGEKDVNNIPRLLGEQNSTILTKNL